MNIKNDDFEININLSEKEKLVKKINENINNRNYKENKWRLEKVKGKREIWWIS